MVRPGRSSDLLVPFVLWVLSLLQFPATVRLWLEVAAVLASVWVLIALTSLHRWHLIARVGIALAATILTTIAFWHPMRTLAGFDFDPHFYAENPLVSIQKNPAPTDAKRLQIVGSLALVNTSNETVDVRICGSWVTTPSYMDRQPAIDLVRKIKPRCSDFVPINPQSMVGSVTPRTSAATANVTPGTAKQFASGSLVFYFAGRIDVRDRNGSIRPIDYCYFDQQGVTLGLCPESHN
jgi:hypothetical protein